MYFLSNGNGALVITCKSNARFRTFQFSYTFSGRVVYESRGLSVLAAALHMGRPPASYNRSMKTHHNLVIRSAYCKCVHP